MARVSGWSAPRTRSRSVSSSSKAAAAPAGLHASPRYRATSARVLRVSGWAAPKTRGKSVSNCSKVMTAAADPQPDPPEREIVMGRESGGMVCSQNPQLLGEQPLEGGGRAGVVRNRRPDHTNAPFASARLA